MIYLVHKNLHDIQVISDATREMYYLELYSHLKNNKMKIYRILMCNLKCLLVISEIHIASKYMVVTYDCFHLNLNL